jgi:hypothetical protein
VYVGFHVECLKSEREREFQLFLYLRKSSWKECSEVSTRSVSTKVQSLPLKAQEGYCCSHSNISASEAQRPCKVCTGWLKVENLSTKGRVEGLLLQKVHRVEESNT